MKKIVLTSLCTLAVAGAAFAQGNVNWQTISFTAMTAQTNSSTYSPLTGGGATGGGAVGAMGGSATGQKYYFQLLYGAYTGSQAAQPATIASLANDWTATTLMATNGGTAGRLATVSPNAGTQVPWSPGTTQSIVLAGWSANLGTTFAAALANLQNWAAVGESIGSAYFGTSATGYITTLSTATSPGAAVFGTAPTAQGLPIFSLNTQLYLLNSPTPVPEPSTLALAGLGGLALLALRRRK